MVGMSGSSASRLAVDVAMIRTRSARCSGSDGADVAEHEIDVTAGKVVHPSLAPRALVGHVRDLRRQCGS